MADKNKEKKEEENTPQPLPKEITKDDLTPELLNSIADLAGLALTQSEICLMLKVNETTFSNWKNSRPDLKEAIARGKADTNESVTRAMFKAATGTMIREVKITSKGNEIVKYHYSDTANERWQTNRMKDRWKKKIELELSGAVGTFEMSKEDKIKLVEEFGIEVNKDFRNRLLAVGADSGNGNGKNN